MFARRLRGALAARGGGWRQLARDMEAGPSAYADVICKLQGLPTNADTPAALLGIRCQETTHRVLATMAAQAFLHATPNLRRSKEVGGDLNEGLGDVRDESTLRDLVIEVRMAYFEEIWQGPDSVRQKIEQAGHLHSLSKEAFWDLWEHCYGENITRFLSRANQHFGESRGLELF
jgi:hypothetical protein